jgi:hypothetical protein
MSSCKDKSAPVKVRCGNGSLRIGQKAVWSCVLNQIRNDFKAMIYTRGF